MKMKNFRKKKKQFEYLLNTLKKFEKFSYFLRGIVTKNSIYSNFFIPMMS